MSPSRLKRYLYLSLALAVAFMPAGCGKKPEKKPPAEAEKVLKDMGIALYPDSQVFNKSVNSTRIRIPSDENPSAYYEAHTANIWLETGDPVDKVRAYYGPSHPHIITEDVKDGQITLLQMASVPDIDKAIADRVSPISLIDVRKIRLSDAERGAYTLEAESLRSLKKPDLMQKKRLQELGRLLEEKTLVQITVRSTA